MPIEILGLLSGPRIHTEVSKTDRILAFKELMFFWKV